MAGRQVSEIGEKLANYCADLLSRHRKPGKESGICPREPSWAACWYKSSELTNFLRIQTVGFEPSSARGQLSVALSISLDILGRAKYEQIRLEYRLPGLLRTFFQDFR